MKIVVVGATGYIGGRLIPRLVEKGHEVRACARSLAKMQGRYWSDRVDLVPADVLHYASLINAMKGCDVAYYLVHSMEREVKDYKKADREAAHNFVRAAKEVGIKRIIYLGGLGRDHLSAHLKSRHEVAAIFEKSSVPTVTLRAAMIIGSGSASFEILRYLVDRLPIMVTPRWVQSRLQPIAVVNVLQYLVEVLNHEEMKGQYDIGGPEIMTYEQLMHTYAEVANLPRRKLLRLRVLTPWLSSHWIALVTPLPAAIGRPLAEGLSSTVICEENRIKEIIPQKLLTIRESIERALERLADNRVETSWIDAGKIPPAEWVEEDDPEWAGGTLFQEKISRIVEKSPEKVWGNLLKIGGERGWYSPQWPWAFRGFIDKLVGGVGLRRGRRNVDFLHLGDAVDFWRVSKIEENRRLQLVAEMKLPGKAVLDFKLEPKDSDTLFTVTASFLPHGLRGIFYWYSLYPFHHWIFRTMLKRLMSDSTNN